MSRASKPKVPSYRLHKPSGQAVVTLPNPVGGRGRDVYLGPHGSPESIEKFNREIAQWNARGGDDVASDVSIVELMALFAGYCDGRYSRGRRLAISAALKPVRELFGRTAAADFDCLALEAVRIRMVETNKWCRNTVNEQVRWIRSFFKWAVRYKHVPPGVLFALQQVPALRPGEHGVEESEPVLPVDDESIAAIKPYRRVSRLHTPALSAATGLGVKLSVRPWAVPIRELRVFHDQAQCFGQSSN